MELRKLRGQGVFLPTNLEHIETWLEITDAFESEPALRLAERLVRGVAARRCFSEISQTLSGDDDKSGPTFPLTNIIIRHLCVAERQAAFDGSSTKFDGDPGWTVPTTTLEWLRTIIMKRWNGKAEVHRWSSVGGAIEFMADLCSFVHLIRIKLIG